MPIDTSLELLFPYTLINTGYPQLLYRHLNFFFLRSICLISVDNRIPISFGGISSAPLDTGWWEC